MNTSHFDQVISNYIDKFAYMNDPNGHNENYKWRIAGWFKSAMDKALASSDDSLPKALYDIRIRTYNLIDSTVLPLTGLSKFAEYAPATVRQMFYDLYSDDGNDLALRMKKISSFLDSAEELRIKYFPTSWKYKNSLHSVTCYQTLYDPDKYYILKPSHCQKFAECIEYYLSIFLTTPVKMIIPFSLKSLLFGSAGNVPAGINFNGSFDPTCARLSSGVWTDSSYSSVQISA